MGDPIVSGLDHSGQGELCLTLYSTRRVSKRNCFTRLPLKYQQSDHISETISGAGNGFFTRAENVSVAGLFAAVIRSEWSLEH
ncbi:MAG: hypothetical protein ACRD68_19195, partial [Pyrinomonadaceae bacterium]